MLSSSDQKRKILTDVSIRFETVEKFQKQLLASDRAFKMAKANYEESLKDYRLGLVTNLDTLTALNTYLDSKRSFDRVSLQLFQAYDQLKTSVGLKP